MTYQDEAQIGDNAGQLLDNPAFQEALTRLRAEVVRQWKKTSLRDRDGQALMLQLARMADDFETILIGMVDAGKFAQAKLDEQKARRERAIDVDHLRNDTRVRSFVRKLVKR